MRARRARIGWAVGAVLIVAYTLLPIVRIASLSFKKDDDINNKRFLPSEWSLDNYRTVFDTNLFTSALRNSIGISLIATVISVVLATFAAYAIARLEFRGKKLVLSMALAIAMFPTVALVGPLFDMWRSLGLYDTWIGLIIPYMSFTLPLSIWTLSAFFREIPWEMGVLGRPGPPLVRAGRRPGPHDERRGPMPTGRRSSGPVGRENPLHGLGNDLATRARRTRRAGAS